MRTHFLLSAALSIILCLTSTAQTLPAYLPSNGLVGWWPFNGNANDESGNGNDGTVNGSVPYISDRNSNISSAIQGGSGYITCPSTVFQFNRDQTFTASIWFTIEVNSNGGRLLSNESTGEYYGNFRIASYGNGELAVQYGDYINDSLETSIWHHYVYTYNNRSEQLFVDGTLKYTNYDNDNAVLNFNSPFTIGAKASPAFDTWNGNIDDIAIYNRALTTEEITALYTGEPVSPPTACNPLPSNLQNGLVGYWPFCGNANDESGNGNDGTVNGATLTEDRFGVSNAAFYFSNNGILQNIQTDYAGILEQNDRSISLWYLEETIASQTEQQVLCGYGGASEATSFAPTTFNGNIGIDVNNSRRHYSNSIQFAWNHAVYIYENGNSISDVKVYLNGILQTTTSNEFGNQNTILNTTPGLNFRINSSIIPQMFFGKIDDIAIYNRALSSEEVQQLYTLNACTFTIYDTVTVTETIYDTVSVSLSTTDTLIINTLITAVQPAQENTFLVYPNPANTQITINNGNFALLGGYRMRITNSAGQEVYNQNITQPEVTLNLNTWGGNGLYILYINDPSNNTIAVKQIVLQ
jgi:hypothetical protein